MSSVTKDVEILKDKVSYQRTQFDHMADKVALFEHDVEEVIGKVLDQRINFDNMADRVIALEDNVDELTKLIESLIKLINKRFKQADLYKLLKGGINEE